MPHKRPAHRPLKENEPLTERLSALFTKSERAGLEKIREEKQWLMATLIRNAMKMAYPEAFVAGKEKK